MTTHSPLFEVILNDKVYGYIHQLISKISLTHDNIIITFNDLEELYTYLKENKLEISKL